MFYYKFYGYIIASNIICPYLSEADQKDVANNDLITIAINEANGGIFQKERIYSFSYSDTTYHGRWKDIVFQIDWDSKRIEATAQRTNDAFLFLLNVPISLLLAYYGKIIIHCSAIMTKNIVIGFCGSKGVGKTTLCSCLTDKDEDIIFFSDDSLCLDFEEKKIFSNYYVIKLTDTNRRILQEEISDFSFVSHNNGKTIYKLGYYGSTVSLSNLQLYFVYRSFISKRIEINNATVLSFLIEDNLVGKNYMPVYIRNKTKSIIDECVREMQMPAKVLLIAEMQMINKHQFADSIWSLL